MPKLFITGSTGLLAGWILPQLQQELSNEYQVLTLKRADLNQLEVANTSWTNDDIILNLAALSNVDSCQQNPHEAYLANIKIPQNFALISKKYGTKIIHISTDHIYDSPKPSTESEVNIRNVYAMSKLAGELALQNGTVQQNTICLRTNFFGKSKARKPSFSDWVFTVFSEKQNPTFFDNIYLSFIHWSTLSAAITTVINNFKPGIYNIGAADSISKADFAIRTAKALGIYHTGYKITQDNSQGELGRAMRPKLMMMDSSLFARTFNFNLPTIDQEIAKLQKEYNNEITTK